MCIRYVLFSLVEEKDRLTKFVRVTSSSLLGLGKFITIVSEEVNTAMEKYSHHLLSEKKFWKFGRHKSPQVSEFKNVENQ